MKKKNFWTIEIKCKKNKSINNHTYTLKGTQYDDKKQMFVWW